ncbi:hypothetical protein BJ742DRAFT_828500 [Cladochytrium replicatum]|nr:hypothetical protein BJ742DRAFT_828500 [Cladochytrium replicatum]
MEEFLQSFRATANSLGFDVNVKSISLSRKLEKFHFYIPVHALSRVEPLEFLDRQAIAKDFIQRWPTDHPTIELVRHVGNGLEVKVKKSFCMGLLRKMVISDNFGPLPLETTEKVIAIHFEVPTGGFDARHLRAMIIVAYKRRLYSSLGYNVRLIPRFPKYTRAIAEQKLWSMIADDPQIYTTTTSWMTILTDLWRGVPNVVSAWTELVKAAIRSITLPNSDFGVLTEEEDPDVEGILSVLQKSGHAKYSSSGEVSIELAKFGTCRLTYASGTPTELAILVARMSHWDASTTRAVVESEGGIRLWETAREISQLLPESQPQSYQLVHVGPTSGFPGHSSSSSILESTTRFMRDLSRDGESDDIHDVETSEILALTTLVVQALSVKSNAPCHLEGQNYAFLQYIHARLCGIEKNSAVRLNIDADLSELFQSRIAIPMTLKLSSFPTLVGRLNIENSKNGIVEVLDPPSLVEAVIELSHKLMSATYDLRVKGQNPSTAEARWLLFFAGRAVVRDVLKLLGVPSLIEII